MEAADYLYTTEILRIQEKFPKDKVECVIKGIARVRGWNDPDQPRHEGSSREPHLYQTDYLFL